MCVRHKECGSNHSSVRAYNQLSMAQSGSNKKVANGLVAVSCGAVLAVYTAGYVRTRAAVEQFEAQAAERRAADPLTRRLESPGMNFRPRAPEPPATALVPAPTASPNRAEKAAGTPDPIASTEAEPASEPTPVLTPPPVEAPVSPPVAPVAVAVAVPAPAPPPPPRP